MKYLTETIHEDNRSYVVEFIRNEDSTKTVNKVTTFYPYFYVDVGCPIEHQEGIVGVQPGFNSILDTPLKKVSVRNTFVTKKLRPLIEQMGFRTWEADIPMHNRYDMDQHELEKGKIKVCFLDIETDMESAAPNIEEADEEITCITTKIDGVKKTWLFTTEEFSYDFTTVFKTEESMLKDFLTYIKVESPDILSAYNIDEFDLKYIINRCKRLDIPYEGISPLSKVETKELKDKTFIKIRGMVVLDMLTAYKLWRKYGNMGQLDSYSLNNVAKTVLNQSKLEHGKRMGELWRHDLKTLVEYNQWDVELIDMLDQRCKIVDFFDNIRRKSHIQIDDVYKTTAIVDGYLIHRLEHKIVLPSASKHDAENLKGADVRDPVPGVFENVMALDVSGMYPNLIKNYNISFETLDPNGEIILPIGKRFKKKMGVIPMFMDELANERKGYKKKMEAAEKSGNKAEYELWYQRQYGTKIIQNSLYGYLCYSGSRLYNIDVAGSITGMGVFTIKKIGALISKTHKILAGDTDSVYVLANEKHPFKVVDEGMALRDLINADLEKFNKELTGVSYVKMELEQILKTIIFLEAKKRYAYFVLWNDVKGFNHTDELKFKGLDLKRSDSCKLSKELQRTTLIMLLNKKSKNEVMDYLKTIDKKLRSGQYPDEEIGFPKGISKKFEEYDPPGPIIKGAIFSNTRYGTNFNSGSKPKYAWIKGIKGYPNPKVAFKDRWYPVEAIVYDKTIPKDIMIDWDRMSESIIKSKVETLFEAVGWKWEPLNMISLNAFM